MSGIEGLEAALSVPGRLAIMGHAVCGWPDLETSRRIFLSMAEAGVDIIEAQIPFSEPSADGPLIVEANHAALRAFGSSSGPDRTRLCLELLGDVRRKTGKPVLLMSYVNPILIHGTEAFVRDAANVGLDGLIVPDYPDDEPELDLDRLSSNHGLARLPLIAPTTSLDRAASLCAASASPLLYAVLRMGVTGRRTELDSAAVARLADLRSRTGKKIAAGFGLRDRAQLDALRGNADCAVLGSVLLASAKTAIEAGGDPARAVFTLVRGLCA